ncbi:hypothetical protein BTH42_33440 [Burkholderia sp. SRS-W-2-2016]|uniref:glycosyltransferase family 2 protein n=1 Tax=Burkholderia sp. SRS-W-2-2016 TaxID=1926878 RepID=UPI00094AFD81|nr:glycosyltransferase family 2 protein [Burkholderia sp. SRS-W-2-2016]OLL27318.1 hypothetical protein BTH42_33440 [Burkholderia sp. SRS-W-2-2016]
MTMILSVIVPTFNEERSIAACIASICDAAQPWSAEVLVVDGRSTDRTREILAGLQQKYPQLQVLDNPDRFQVNGLNVALKHAKGKYVVRCDAHSIYPPGYFSNFIDHFEQCGDASVGNIGSPYVTRNDANTPVKEGIAYAMSSPLGVGLSHRSSTASEKIRAVDTLLFGAWRREVFETVGFFDEQFVRGQDYEHNLRLRKHGLQVLMIPGAPFIYTTRSSFRNLRRMVYQYAYAKGQIMVKHRLAPNVRSMIPACALLSTPALMKLGMFNTTLAFYGAAVALESLRASVSRRSLGVGAGVLTAIPMMHVSHAVGVIVGVLDNLLLNGRSRSMTSTR